MITFKCTATKCANKDIKFNFMGNPVIAECGSCGKTLIGYDLRQDPEEVVIPFGSSN